MKLSINGETKEFTGEVTLKKVIEILKVEDKIMAVAVNMRIVKKYDWDSFNLKNNDKLELLQFVGGG